MPEYTLVDRRAEDESQEEFDDCTVRKKQQYQGRGKGACVAFKEFRLGSG